MNWTWRWMISDFVPHDSGLSDQQRGALRRRIHQHRVIYILPVAWLLGAVFGAVFYAYGDFASRAPVALPIGIIAGVAGNIALSFIVGRMLTPFIVAQLNDMGVDVCPTCGYALDHTDQKVDHCPRCGGARN